ncbi:MAG: hypothetical protein P8L44_12760 [Opitutales bacterium]|nr:hypothetical protein [Opitutales bacterium]
MGSSVARLVLLRRNLMRACLYNPWKVLSGTQQCLKGIPGFPVRVGLNLTGVVPDHHGSVFKSVLPKADARDITQSIRVYSWLTYSYPNLLSK